MPISGNPRLIVRCAVALVGLALAGLVLTAAARADTPPPPQFETGNDTAPPADWNSQIVVRNQCEILLDNEIFVEGSGAYRAARLRETSVTCYVTKSQRLGSTGPYQRHAFHIRISTLPVADTHIWSLRTLPFASQSLIVHPDGRLSILNVPQDIAHDSGSHTIRPGVWYALQFDVTHHDTAGEFVLQVDGVPWIERSGLDTKAGFDAFSVRLGLQSTVKDTMAVHYDHYRWWWATAPLPKEHPPSAAPTRLFFNPPPVWLPLALRGGSAP